MLVFIYLAAYSTLTVYCTYLALNTPTTKYETA
jgi:hypothetical protein